MGILKKLLHPDEASAPTAVQSASQPRGGRSALTPTTPSAPVVVPEAVRSVIKKPLVTEKSSLLNSQNQYVFAIARSANKIQVSRAVEQIYGVKPVAVRVITVLGKTRVRGRIQGRTANWKKAIVTLPAGKSIRVSE